jgi:DNA-directed RNA polymerase specialized sigma24 family protein
VASADAEFTAFVTQRADALLRVAYALTGDQHAAQDLVQNAFAKAFVRWRRISGDPEPYLRRIIYHDFVSVWRGRRRRMEVSVAAPPQRSVAGSLDHDTAVRLMLREAVLDLRQSHDFTGAYPAWQSRSGFRQVVFPAPHTAS